MFICVEVEPPELFAQTVYATAVVCNAVGVPLMAPVLELNVRPRVVMDGLISHVVTAPPLMDGVVVDIAVPLVSVKLWDEYTIEFGARSTMVMFISVEAEPPELLAQIV
tara:strand:- start:6 stop:332 length:327 start_codon:yes stop_codon:yes gene_type:complete